MINDHKKLGEWKIQLTMSINFISFKDCNETYNIYIWSDNIEIMMGSKTNNIIKKLCKLLLQGYQKVLKESQKKVTLFLIVLVCCIITFIKQV